MFIASGVIGVQGGAYGGDSYPGTRMSRLPRIYFLSEGCYEMRSHIDFASVIPRLSTVGIRRKANRYAGSARCISWAGPAASRVGSGAL